MADLPPDPAGSPEPIASGFYLMLGIVVFLIGLFFFLLGHSQGSDGHLMEIAGLIAGVIGAALVVSSFIVRGHEGARARR